MFSFFTHQDHGNQNRQLSNTVSSISILPNYTSNTSQLKERQARLKTLDYYSKAGTSLLGDFN